MRPEPGFSLYEGRTRGKRLKYTYSDDEADASDATSNRRSTRVATPADPSKPVVTASGRQVRSRVGGAYGESMLSGQNTNQPTPATGDYEGSEGSDAPVRQHGRSTRSGGSYQVNDWNGERKHIAGYNELDEMDDEEDAMSSGGEWDNPDDDDVDDGLHDNDEEEDLSSGEEDDFEPKSFIIKLQYRKEPGGVTRHANGHKSVSSALQNGGPVSSAVNGHHTEPNSDQDLDTIVVQQKPPPHVAPTSVQHTKLTSAPFSKTSAPVSHKAEAAVAPGYTMLQALTSQSNVAEPKPPPKVPFVESVDQAKPVETLNIPQEAPEPAPMHQELGSQLSTSNVAAATIPSQHAGTSI